MWAPVAIQGSRDRLPAVQRLRLLLPRLLPTVVLLFVFAWAVDSIIVTGGGVLAVHYRPLVRTPPAVNQFQAGDPVAQSLITISGSIPRRDRVLIVWDIDDGKTESTFWYGFVWGTFWLYPRQVTVSSYPRSAQTTTADTVIEVRRYGSARLDVAAGYFTAWEYEYPGYPVGQYRHNPDEVHPPVSGATVTVFRPNK